MNAVRALGNLGAAAFNDSATRGEVVKAVHVTELRSNLDQALQAVGLGGLVDHYTNAVARGVVVRAIDFQEIRNKVK